MLLIGAAIGVGYGRGIARSRRAVALSPALCGIVAMSGMFSAAARTPLTSFLFAFELTGNYHAVVPLMIGCMFADVTARSLMRESIMTERLTQRGLRAAAPSGAAPAGLAARARRDERRGRDGLRQHAARYRGPGMLTDVETQSLRWALPVVADDGTLVGMTTRGELMRAMTAQGNHTQPAGDFATSNARLRNAR